MTFAQSCFPSPPSRSRCLGRPQPCGSWDVPWELGSAVPLSLPLMDPGSTHTELAAGYPPQLRAAPLLKAVISVCLDRLLCSGGAEPRQGSPAAASPAAEQAHRTPPGAPAQPLAAEQPPQRGSASAPVLANMGTAALPAT